MNRVHYENSTGSKQVSFIQLLQHQHRLFLLQYGKLNNMKAICMQFWPRFSKVTWFGSTLNLPKRAASRGPGCQEVPRVSSLLSEASPIVQPAESVAASAAIRHCLLPPLNYFWLLHQEQDAPKGGRDLQHQGGNVVLSATSVTEPALPGSASRAWTRELGLAPLGGPNPLLPRVVPKSPLGGKPQPGPRCPHRLA